MWYECENGNDVRPSEIDTTSSRKYTYVRRNIERMPETGTEAEQEYMPAHYHWEEMKIPKEAWGIYQKAAGNGKALDDVYGALTELAELIVG